MSLVSFVSLVSLASLVSWTIFAFVPVNVPNSFFNTLSCLLSIVQCWCVCANNPLISLTCPQLIFNCLSQSRPSNVGLLPFTICDGMALVASSISL